MEDRYVSPNEIVLLLRALVGEAADEPTSDELAASVRRLLPPKVSRYAASRWVWSLVGERLFAEGPPTLAQVHVESRRVVMALAMLWTQGNLSAAAVMLSTSRRTLRAGLRRLGLYPWPGGTGNDQGDDSEPNRRPGLAFMLRELPSVVEDGTRGVVWFKLEGRDDVGPAWLERGDQSERLIRGWWVDRETVEAYALEYGHEFRGDG